MQENLNRTLQHIEQECKKRGKQLTKPRQRVLTALLKTPQPLKAYDIIEKIGDVKPMTVYRALDFLSQQGFIHRIESLNAYTSCIDQHCAHKDSLYMICENCNKTIEIHDHDIDNFIKRKSLKHNFKTHVIRMELLGICEKCQIK